MALEFFELVSGRSPGQIGFGQEGGRAVEKYISSEPLTVDQITDEMRRIVGDVDFDQASPYRLRRTPPMCHPVAPNLFARDVQVTGLGVRDSDGNVMTVAVVNPHPTYGQLDIPPIVDRAAVYARAELTVSFEPRNYNVLNDEDVVPEELSYYKMDDGSSPSGLTTVSREWTRYVDEEVLPSPQLAHFTTGGQLYFRTGSEPVSGELDPGGANPMMFAGTSFVVLPDGKWRLIWYMVPYRIFLTRTHYLYRLYGHLNQRAFFNWQPGQLLYMGATARRYCPTFAWASQTLEGETSFSAEKLCDIVFEFHTTTREVTNPPALESVRGAWIPGGFNSAPWAPTRKFYTVSSSSTDNAAPNSEWVPQFPSAPFELLFDIRGVE